MVSEQVECGEFRLGTSPVAVKLYSNCSTWQREACVYALPHVAHPNILRYYGSDSRATLTEGGREHLIVVELCTSTLRARLQSAPLAWIEFAHIAHGLASALAHLHTPCGREHLIVVELCTSTLRARLQSAPLAWIEFAHIAHGLASALAHLHTPCGREHLIIVELCTSTLRARLQSAPLAWIEFAHIAHGLAFALAHLHTPSGSKPCVVHRDVNSNNVLVTANGEARLADLGLAQLLHAARDRAAPTRITEVTYCPPRREQQQRTGDGQRRGALGRPRPGAVVARRQGPRRAYQDH
ncbi:hypothetical protein PYW07_011739 [Mythimna separata]|uniref:receptor protein serine/threonine kinase n=1 Tax=Mythimna separata TaxID=271217 RepID=A0AAD7Y6P1_MYTSE|nr:hypothetical protein PYW07_011739 [Mythimna separata]